MKQLYFLVTLLLSTSLFSQKIITEKINSKEFTKGRSVKIYIPKDYDKDETVSYPLAFILGSGYLFDMYVGNAKLYANSDKAPRQIIVGIDMETTYNKDVSIIPSNNALTETAERFQTFIKKELIAYMEINYRTSPFMTIAGEGKAANFISYFLKDANPIFNSYICITPELTEFNASRIESYSLSRLGSIDNSYFIYSSNSKEYITKKQYDLFNQTSIYLSSFNKELKFSSFLLVSKLCFRAFRSN